MSVSLSPSSSKSIWPIRTFLFVPAIRPEWIPKAIAASPDAVILDLEDLVAPSDKSKARVLVPGSVRTLQAKGIHAFVKINAVAQGGDEDLRACVIPEIAGILVPKASVEDIRSVHDILSYCEGRAGVAHGGTSIIALPETAEGLLCAYDIAGASSRVQGLLHGVGPMQGDFAAAVGYRSTVEGTEQLYLQSKIVLDSRAAGARYPIAGVFASSIDDLAMIEVMVNRAKTLGYSGVHLIHPSHVAVANRLMSPTLEEVEYFQGLIEALEEAHRVGQGAVRYRGAMVDYAMLATAKQVAAEAQRKKGRT